MDTTINDMILVSNSWAHTLFDNGESHSFISISFVSMLALEYETLDSTLSVGVPLGKDCELSFRSNSICIEIDGWKFLIDLIIMPLEQFDVILSMDWLSRYQAVTNCTHRRVSLFTKNDHIIYQANQHAIRLSPILQSFIRSKRRLETYGSLFAINTEMGIGANYTRLYVVDEFLDVFSENLSRLPLDREIEFFINLVSGA